MTLCYGKLCLALFTLGLQSSYRLIYTYGVVYTISVNLNSNLYNLNLEYLKAMGYELARPVNALLIQTSLLCKWGSTEVAIPTVLHCNARKITHKVDTPTVHFLRMNWSI